MKTGDRIKAIKNLYNAFPIKESLITSGKYYNVESIGTDTFIVIDDMNQSRTFFKVEFNELFVNFSTDIEQFIRQLDSCVKLNKSLPIKNYDYIIKNYKSFTMDYINTPISFNSKQFNSLTIGDTEYSCDVTTEFLLIELSNKYAIIK